MKVIGPPCADWSYGFADAVHYIDSGPTEFAIISANSQTVAKLSTASKDIRAYGFVATEGRLTVKGTFVFSDAVDIVKLPTNSTSGRVQVPTVMKKQDPFHQIPDNSV